MIINDKYKIESDSLNIILCQVKSITGTGRGRASTKQVGEKYWTPIAYLSSFQNALEYLVDHEIKGTGLQDFETVVKKQQELYDLIKTLQCPQA